MLVGVTVVATVAATWTSTASHEGLRAALVIVAVAGFGAMLVVQRRQPFLDLRTVTAAAAVVLAAAVVAPPRGSLDLYAYAAYGRLTAHYHESPYTVRPDAHPDDPIVRAMAPGWRPAKSVYGPVFTAVSAGAMAVTGRSVLGARLFFQLLAALATAAALVLVWRRTRDPAALAFLGLNPVVAVAVVNGGHNDVLVGLGVLAAVLLAAGDRFALAGVVLALAALVKVAAVLGLAGLVLYLLVRRGWRAAAAGAVPAAALVAAAYLVAGGLDAARPILQGTHDQSRASIWLALLRVVDIGKPRLSAAPSTLQQLQLLAVLTVGLVALVTVAGRVRDRDPALAAGTAVVAYLLAAAYVLPWYAAWALPVLALAWRSRLALLAAAHAGLLLLAYEDTPSAAHGGAVHHGLRLLWAYVLPALEVAAVVALVAVAAGRIRRRAGGPAVPAATQPS